jgi:predicted TIM-barrel fold metal-dependent hydrolase
MSDGTTKGPGMASIPNQAPQADDLPWFISVDDHVVEPPTVWSDRLPAKYQDVGPRYARRRIGLTRWQQGAFVTDKDDNGAETDVWLFEDVVKPIRRNIAAAGLDRDEMDLNPISFDEMRKGCFDAAARLADMDLNHVGASLCFPQMSRFCGQEFSEAKDKDLGLACVKAYNDWMVDEWCATDPARLIPLIMVPLWDGELAAAEVRRNAERGVHAVTFSENPYVLGFPSIHSGAWEPFFRACAETDTTVNMHIGSSSKMATVSPDAVPAVGASLSSANAVSSLMEFLFSGVLERYPTLLLAYSEGQIGWIPYQLERADAVWSEHRAWNGLKGEMKQPPSHYYYRQVYGCVFRDFFGMRNLADVGEDNVTFEVDYPHTDSTFPNTVALAREMFAGLTDEQRYKVCRGNAIRMLHLDQE